MSVLASAFIFIPAREKGALWDVWVFHAHDTYYLFYDFVPPGRGITAFAVATSQGGGFYGYCTATAKDGDIWCIGFGETLDGVIGSCI